MKRVLTILLLVCAAGLLVYFSSRQDKLPAGQGSGGTKASQMQQFLALEAAENEHDQTTWAPEMQALLHEMVFVRLWDELRQSEDAFQPLSSFEFGSLRFATNISSQTILEHGIGRKTFPKADRQLDADGFRSLLQQWKSAGWQLEQSEFRHPYFAATNRNAVSIINFTFHAARPAEEQRMILRGELQVLWNSTPGQPPFPRLISVRSLEILERSGPLPFTAMFSEVLPPVQDLETLDPYLLVYDLTGDHLPEIALATHNALLRYSNGTFTPEPLCERPRRHIHAGIFGDFNGDGKTDFLAADLAGLWLYAGDGSGKFPGEPQPAWRASQPLFNPFVLTSGDIDADGDQDIWLAQYKLPYIEGQMPTPYYDANDGFPSFLLVNDGRGSFSDQTEAAGLAKKRFRRTYSNSFVDLEPDGDLDLIVVSDFAGIDIHLNDGRGKFTDATAQLVPNPHGFGMAHSLADFNQDGTLDILMIGMDSAVAERLDSMRLGRAEFPAYQLNRRSMAHGNRLLFRSGEGYVETEPGQQITKAGWAWGVTAFDFDNDTDLDIYIVNGHNSRASAADYETQFWRHDIYVGTSESDPVKDMFFRANATKLYGAGLSYGGYHLNRFYLNEGGTNYVEVAYLLGLSLQEDCRNLVSADIDGDGRLDLIFTTFQQWPARQQGLHIFRNNATAGNWAKLVQDSWAPGATVIVDLPSGKRRRMTSVTGDSYRSQPPAEFHLGLGAAASVKGEFSPGVSDPGRPFAEEAARSILLK